MTAIGSRTVVNYGIDFGQTVVSLWVKNIFLIKSLFLKKIFKVGKLDITSSIRSYKLTLIMQKIKNLKNFDAF